MLKSDWTWLKEYISHARKCSINAQSTKRSSIFSSICSCSWEIIRAFKTFRILLLAASRPSKLQCISVFLMFREIWLRSIGKRPAMAPHRTLTLTNFVSIIRLIQTLTNVWVIRGTPCPWQWSFVLKIEKKHEKLFGGNSGKCERRIIKSRYLYVCKYKFICCFRSVY